MNLSLIPLAVVALLVVVGGMPSPAASQDGPPDLERMLEFVPVSPGSFLMGSPATESGRRPDETRHRVTLTRPYYIGAREVTQYLWQQVMGYDNSYQAGCLECPVENVNWYEAIEFCNRLSRQMGLEPPYITDGLAVTWRPEASGVRLPTEAEWEFAYRAGTDTTFPTGACCSADQANLNGYLPWADCPAGLWRGQTIPVGSLPVEPGGTWDMGGNVAEWCWDAFADLTAGPAEDPTGPGAGDERVQRGGAFNAAMVHARSAARLGSAPGVRATYRGFRLALTPGSGTQEGP